MKIEKILIDGKIFNAGDIEPKLSSGVFETLRAHEENIFLLDEHFARLQKSLKALNIKPIDEKNTEKDIRQITSLAPEDAFIRLVVDKNQTVICMASIPRYSIKPIEPKILNSITHKKPEHFEEIGFRLKSTDYLDLLAENTLPEDRYGIMLDQDGYVAEALTANVFWVKSAQIYTSPLSLGILAGTVRDYLIKANKVSEELIKAPELLEADEIFLTNGVNYIMPAGSIDGIKKPGTKGQVFLHLYDQISKSIKT